METMFAKFKTNTAEPPRGVAALFSRVFSIFPEIPREFTCTPTRFPDVLQTHNIFYYFNIALEFYFLIYK